MPTSPQENRSVEFFANPTRKVGSSYLLTQHEKLERAIALAKKGTLLSSIEVQTTLLSMINPLDLLDDWCNDSGKGLNKGELFLVGATLSDSANKLISEIRNQIDEIYGVDRNSTDVLDNQGRKNRIDANVMFESIIDGYLNGTKIDTRALNGAQLKEKIQNLPKMDENKGKTVSLLADNLSKLNNIQKTTKELLIHTELNKPGNEAMKKSVEDYIDAAAKVAVGNAAVKIKGHMDDAPMMKCNPGYQKAYEHIAQFAKEVEDITCQKTRKLILGGALIVAGGLSLMLISPPAAIVAAASTVVAAFVVGIFSAIYAVATSSQGKAAANNAAQVTSAIATKVAETAAIPVVAIVDGVKKAGGAVSNMLNVAVNSNNQPKDDDGVDVSYKTPSIN